MKTQMLLSGLLLAMQIIAQPAQAQFDRQTKTQRFSKKSQLEARQHDLSLPKLYDIASEMRLHPRLPRLDEAIGGEFKEEIGRLDAIFTQERSFELQQEPHHRCIELRNELLSNGVSAAAVDTITAAWIARYNGPANESDLSFAIAVDGLGSVYVTGGSEGSGTGYDYATIKYNTTGAEVWVARYNGPTNYSDYAEAIAVDGSGNVYVTGVSEGSNTSYDDYTTIKYTPTGTEAWVARYNGPGNAYDYVKDLAVDGLGNVYVTGRSEGLDTDFDYATIKYTSAGTAAWIARYNGPRNGTDGAMAIAVDSSGNVYVTGDSYGTGSDYTTIKYTTEGTEAWVSRYNGPGDGSDYAQAIAVDDSGNVYVTGFSYDRYNYEDYATIKYTAEGTEAWVARYNGPGNYGDLAWSLAVDGSGNVYVTGSSVGSGTSWDYATIKYSAAGTELWVVRYNGLGPSDDHAGALAVDGSGNVYVTGESEFGWVTDMDYATIKYTAAGAEAWIAHYNKPRDFIGIAVSLTVDGSGNVYVTGPSKGSGIYDDYATIKYEQPPVSVEESNGPLPESYILNQNYPNPFNLATTISFCLAAKSLVTLKVFDVLGKLVATLLSEELPPGHYSQRWTAVDLPSGVYFYRLQAGSFVKTKKLILLK